MVWFNPIETNNIMNVRKEMQEDFNKFWLKPLDNALLEICLLYTSHADDE